MRITGTFALTLSLGAAVAVAGVSRFAVAGKAGNVGNVISDMNPADAPTRVAYIDPPLFGSLQ